jgi:hypothetical protein
MPLRKLMGGPGNGVVFHLGLKRLKLFITTSLAKEGLVTIHETIDDTHEIIKNMCCIYRII